MTQQNGMPEIEVDREPAAEAETLPAAEAETLPAVEEIGATVPAAAPSSTPGLDAYRELLDLQDNRDRHLAAIDGLEADIVALQAQRSEHHAILSGLPSKAKALQDRVKTRVDAIVGAFS